jgi:hypothetical protein
MKCIQDPKTLQVKRISDDMVSSYIIKGWKFTSKENWKKDPDTTWCKSSTPANPMSESKKRRKEMRNGQ